ncbi:MAG: hypothetical protein ACLP8B_12005 [Xanthobacteraceae bacterium]
MNTMPLPTRFDASRIAIKEHVCPQCAGAMVLVHVKPARIGFESRTFEGVNCGHVDRIIVATKAVSWSWGSLRAHV